VKTCPTNAISWGTKEDMVALGNKKVERLNRRGFQHAALYNPEGVGGTHMMYVVPHGNRLDDYQLPADPLASPGNLSRLGVLKSLGAYLMGFGALAALVHYLGVGPDVPAAQEYVSAEEEH